MREQRRFRRLRRIAIAALALLTVVAVTAAVVAFVKQHEATQQRERAERERDQAVALKLTSQGESMLAGVRGGGDVRALQQILAASQIAPSADAGAQLTAVMARRDTVKIIATPGGQPLMGFSPDGNRIVSGSNDKTLRVWDTGTGQPIGQPLTGHTGAVLAVAFSRDGNRIVSGGLDKTVRMWDADTGQPIGAPLTGHTGSVFSVALSPDGRRIVSGGDNTVRIWDADTGHPVGAPLTGHTGRVFSVAFSPDGTPDRLRQRRQDGAGVGRRHRPAHRPTADRPHRLGDRCGV